MKLFAFVLALAFLVVAVLARPDVDICTADLAKSRVRDMVGSREINALCVLADRGYLGTDVTDCLKKVGAAEEALLGRHVSHADAYYICDAVRDVVVRYLASQA